MCVRRLGQKLEPKPGEPALPGQPPHPGPRLQQSVLKDRVATRLMEAAEASGGTGQTHDTRGGKAESGRGSSSWLLNTDEGWGGWSTVRPGISQPESPPLLAAPEHSLWPTATEMSACQDTWRRRKTRHQKQNKKVPTPGEARNKQNSGPRSHQIRKTPGGRRRLKALPLC